MIERLEKMLAAGDDNALLRFSLGNAYMKTDSTSAAVHLRRAVELDPNYSAAWKLLGRVEADLGNAAAAKAAFDQGLKVAEARGDMQAMKEMKVFLKRLEKSEQQ